MGFDAIYTGYLGSFDQLEIVCGIFDEFGNENNTIFVDPVMGDGGALYPGFTPEFAKAMASLCAKADVIVPNITEACFMLGVPFIKPPYKKEDIEDLLKRFADMGVRRPCLTGIAYEEGKTGVVTFNPKEGSFYSFDHDRVPASYHGTGDIFASACVGALMNGLTLEKSLSLAALFTAESIKITYEGGKKQWYGVDFEYVLPKLSDMLNKAETL